MSVYRFAWSYPGIIFVDGDPQYGDITIPVAIDNKEFLRWCMWEREGNVTLPPAPPPWWPLPVAVTTIPYTEEEITEAIENIYWERKGK